MSRPGVGTERRARGEAGGTQQKPTPAAKLTPPQYWAETRHRAAIGPTASCPALPAFVPHNSFTTPMECQYIGLHPVQ